MNKNLYIVGIVVLLQTMFVQASISGLSYDQFLTASGAIPARNNIESNSVQAITGDADRLIRAMGEVPVKLIEIPVKRWGLFLYRNVWEADPTKKVIGQDCDKSGDCVDVYQPALTPEELAKKQQERLKNLYQYYAKITQPIETLSADIAALQVKKDKINNVNLRAELDNLLIVARDAEELFRSFVKKQKENEEKSKEENEKKSKKDLYDLELVNFLPSAILASSISQSIDNLKKQLDILREVEDQKLIGVYNEILELLEKIQAEVNNLKKSNNNDLQKSLALAQNKLMILKRSGNKGNNEDKINVLSGAVESLKVEILQDTLEKEAKDKHEQTLKSDASFKSLYTDFLTSISSKSSLDSILEVMHAELESAKQQNNKYLIMAHEKVIALVKNVQKTVLGLKKHNNLEQALKLANNDLQKFINTSKISSINSFEEQINLWQAVVKVLEVELNQEVDAINNKSKQNAEALEQVDRLIEENQKSANKALSKMKNEISDLEAKLLRLNRLGSNSQVVENLRNQIATSKLVEENLRIKAEEETIATNREDQEVVNIVQNLLVKNSFNYKKALTESLQKVNIENSSNSFFSTSFFSNSEDLKIKFIKNKVDNSIKLTKEEKVALKINNMVQNEKENDPLNVALVKLNNANAGEMESALANVMSIALGKAGISMDRLDITTRQNVANNLKKTSDELISIINSPRLTEQQKQLQKQIVVKAMLTNNSSLLAAGVTGASLDALKTGDAQTIATDIALNKLINVLVPAQPTMPNFDFSALNSSAATV